MKLKNSYLLFFPLAIPVFFVFRAFFLPGPLAWGDAPFYSPESLKSLFNEPFAWVNQATLGHVNDLYWIYPISLLFGALHKFIGIESNSLIRLLFYFPALLASVISPILLTRYLRFPKVVQFFSSLLYTFDTYFVLLVDGGQVGVALAYGLFPLGLLFLHKLKDKVNISKFYQALGVFMLLIIADARIAIICLFAFLLWMTADVVGGIWKPTAKHAKILPYFCISILGLSAYWLFPAVKLLTTGVGESDTPLQLLSLLNPLFLFQPHWPANEFGKVFPVPFFFVGIPLLAFGTLLVNKKQNYVLALCVLIFAFLAKGTTPPLGGAYELFLNRVPLGSAFRDSSKFLIPTIALSSILIGITANNLFLWAKKRNTISSKILIGAIAIYLIFLVSPALTGEMKGVLAGRQISQDYEKVNNLIQSDQDSFRTAWFPEKHPWGYSTYEKPGIDAKSLVDERPFASINTGTFDRFNFMHNSLSIDWLQLFGIKYLVLPGDTRKVPNDEEEKDWSNLKYLIDSTDELKKIENSKVPMYQVADTKPKVFQVDKAVFVVGSDNIYEKLKIKDKNFSIANQGFVFLEDGKFNPKRFKDIASDSAILVINEKTEQDFTLSFTQKYFTTPENSSQWAIRSSQDFLKWKYELLVNGISSPEFDYGKGIAFSTNPGEKLTFKLVAYKDGDYVLVVRHMGIGKGILTGTFANEKVNLNIDKNFSWSLKERIHLKKGNYYLEITSNDVIVVNTAGLIPFNEFEDAKLQSKNYQEKFETYLMTKSNTGDLENILKGNSVDIAFKYSTPVKVNITPDQHAKWVVFTDSYNPLWNLEKNETYLEGFPFYSSMNGFYLQYPWKEANIVFKGQKEVRWGLYFTCISMLLLAVIFFYKKAK